ncbi:MAG: DUF3306 domain-containing protein [Gammaproteobacteria bacterium]|nr:DUF3306 domain-containing protein [Gammaproteobacteria bacterium]
MTRDSKESGLRRWSRRKQESAQEAPAAEQAVPIDTEPSLGTTAPIEIETESRPALTDADMPPIESLDEDSDYSAFMSEGVSDELRNLALRKLFKAPVFNIRDGLDEYDEDYTYFEKLGDIVTCDMKHHIEMKEQREREALALEAEQEIEDEIEVVEAIDEETDDELEEIEDSEGEETLEDQPEIMADTDLNPAIKQELKHE